MTKVLVVLILISCLARLSVNLTVVEDDEIENDYMPSFEEILDIGETFSTSDASQKACSSKDCEKLADHIERNMNTAADPCDDFFDYSCGAAKLSTFKEIGSNTERDLRSIIIELGKKKRELGEVDSKVYNWYSACIDMDTRDSLGGGPLKKLIDSFGGAPAIDPSWDESSWSLVKAVAGNHRKASGDVLFSSGFYGNDSNVHSPLQLGLFDAKLGLKLPELYLNRKSPYVQKVLGSYFVLLYELAKLLGGQDGWVLARDMAEVVKLEIHLAGAIHLAQKDHKRNAMRTTIGHLNKASKGAFDWRKYLGLLYKDIPGVKHFKDDDEIVIHHPLYVEKILGLIDYYTLTNKRSVLANYIMSQVAMQYGGALSRSFRNVYLRFYHHLYGLTKFSPDWTLCVRSTNKHLSSDLGYLFVKKNFKDPTLNQAIDLVHQLRETYLEHMKNHVKWMDPKTRAEAEKKIKNLKQFIGYSRKILDPKYRLKVTKDMKVDPSTYFENVLCDYKLSVAYQLKQLGAVPKRGGFDMALTAQNAQYEPSANKIVVAAGILRAPLFDQDYPKAVNYGGIGMAIGHEITHGFDLSGCQYDDQGNRRLWWTKQTYKAFKQRAECLEKEYSSFEILGHHLRGKQTINENIADNGGLRIAYQAYLKYLKEHAGDTKLPGRLGKLSPQQLFFVSFAQVWCAKPSRASILHRIASDVHSLARFRVRGVVRNMKEFAKAFKCPKGSKMNPSKKCIVW